jgi:hypothetical protein
LVLMQPRTLSASFALDAAQLPLAAPMERFDEALALMAVRMGFQALGYVKLNDGTRRDMWSMFSSALSAADLQRMSTYGRGWEPRSDRELVQAVERVASVDLRMYLQAAHIFNNQVLFLAPLLTACGIRGAEA